MAMKKTRTKAIIQLRRATEAQWTARDPVLRLAEPALSTDNNRIKIGDGVHRWSELKYTLGNYEELANKPIINEVILSGLMTSEDLGLQSEMEAIEEEDIDRILFGGDN